MAVKTCPCGVEFETKRAAAKYCSDRCRKRAQRSTGGKVIAFGTAQAPSGPAPVREPGPLEAAARAELEAVDRAGTLAGTVVLALARRVDAAGPLDTGSAFASLTKELRAALAAALEGVQKADDPIDELREQRDRRRRRAR